MGRRWGKTTLAQELLLAPDEEHNGALHGYPVAYCAPTYKMLMDFWQEMTTLCTGFIKSKNEQEKRIELYGGGVIDFWSLDAPDTIRGRKYKRVVLDEAALAQYLKYVWTQVIRPMLSDLQGDAFFLSTPKGKINYFYDLFQNPDKYEDWAAWQMPTSTNPLIHASEIESARLQLDPVSFAQEYLASFITDELDAWAYSYDPAKHMGKTTLNKQREVYLSFDFNRNPITCGVFQHDGTQIRGIEQIKLRNSNIYNLCDYITANYTGCMFIVTGDATGKASSALVQDNINYYTVIKNKLNLSNGQLRLPTVNPPIQENRVLVNSILHNCDIIFDKDKCQALHFDLEHAKVLPDGKLDKMDREDPTKQLDALDCLRYYLNTFHKHILKN